MAPTIASDLRSPCPALVGAIRLPSFTPPSVRQLLYSLELSAFPTMGFSDQHPHSHRQFTQATRRSNVTLAFKLKLRLDRKSRSRPPTRFWVRQAVLTWFGILFHHGYGPKL